MCLFAPNFVSKITYISSSKKKLLTHRGNINKYLMYVTLNVSRLLYHVHAMKNLNMIGRVKFSKLVK